MMRLTAVVCVVAILSVGLLASAAFAKDKSATPKPKLADRVYVKMETSMGDIMLELNQEKAPITVKNFLSYTNDGFYDGTIFHRVIGNFMIQGGGFDANLQKKKVKAGIKNEWRNGLKNTTGTIAMARIGGQPDSGSSQFFINVRDNHMLNRPQRDGAAYAVFGRVVDGMDVVNKIKAVKTQPKPNVGDNCPVETVLIKKVSVLDEKAAEKLQAELKRKAEKKMEEQFTQAMEFIKTKGADPAKVVKTKTGLQYVDTVEGSGDMPPKGAKVEVHYTGWLTNGSKFDSSVDRNQPFVFSLSGGVIEGWLEGVATMKVGGKRFLVIPPDLGYGAGGTGPIPPNAVLIFEVELLGIK